MCIQLISKYHLFIGGFLLVIVLQVKSLPLLLQLFYLFNQFLIEALLLRLDRPVARLPLLLLYEPVKGLILIEMCVVASP